MKRLTKIEADYNDVIPKRDYLALETVYNELKSKNEIVDSEFTKLKHEFM